MWRLLLGFGVYMPLGEDGSELQLEIMIMTAGTQLPEGCISQAASTGSAGLHHRVKPIWLET